MSNYLDNIDVIDAAGENVNVLLQDRETLALCNQVSANLATEITDRENADTALRNDLNTEITNRTQAINTLTGNINTVDGKIGVLSNLKTRSKTNVVSSINSVYDSLIYINVKDYGAVGDGTTDDTAAIKDAIDVLNVKGGVLYFPQGRYKITDTLNITHLGSCVKGETEQGTYILQYADKTALHFGNGSTPTISYRVENIGIVCMSNTITSATYGIHYDYAVNSTIDNVVIGDFYVGVFLTHTGNSFINDVGVVATKSNCIGFNVGDQSVSTAFTNCYVGFSNNAVDSGIGFYAARGDIADISIDYLDVGNGAYGVYFDGLDSPADYPAADIRLRNIVVDGSRIAAIKIQNINNYGNVVIDGGWLNPNINASSKCIEISNANNVLISNMIMQQLAPSANPTVFGISVTSVTNINIEHCQFINLLTALSSYTADKISFVNNHVILYSGMVSPSYALNLATTYTAIVTNNNIYGTFAQGVTLDGNGDYSIITNNIFTGITTAISDAHTNKIVTNNLT